MKSITGGLERKENKSPTPLVTTDKLYVSLVEIMNYLPGNRRYI